MDCKILLTAGKAVQAAFKKPEPLTLNRKVNFKIVYKMNHLKNSFYDT
jgi:hypothetical protein